MPAIDLKNCEIAFLDGTSPTPQELVVKVAEGMIRWSEKRNRNYLLDRGELDEVQEGDHVPMDVSLDLRYAYIVGDADITPVDFLKRVGNAADYPSTDDDTCSEPATTIRIIHTPVCSDDKLEQVLLPDFRHESLDFDPKAATISCSGRCNAREAITTRIAQ